MFKEDKIDRDFCAGLGCIILLVFLITYLVFIFFAVKAHNAESSPVLTASWYSTAEYPEGVMANGEKLDDTKFTCASWDYPFNTRLLVYNKANAKSVQVKVADRGPGLRLYKNGRIIDLSKAAFNAVADLDQGVISVDVKVLK